MNVVPVFRIDLLEGEADLEGVLEVERESFTSPWTREMYAWELQNRAVCHIYIVRTPECPVAGFCAFWLVFDEIHINNIALRPQYRGFGYGTALMHHVLAEATDHHPAQVTVWHEDVIVGTWTTTKLSGALPASRVAELLGRVTALHDAVRHAREEANCAPARDVKIGKLILDYVLA